MHRRSLKMRNAFPKSADEYTQPVERVLRHRRAELDAEWGRLEERWTANNKRMATLKVRPRTGEESMVTLNAGGWKVSVWWHLLADAEGFEDSILGALLEGVWGEGRIPRDGDGHIVLDESPASIKLIIHTMLRATSNGRRGSVVMGLPEGAPSSAVALDEVACLIYTAHAMGLPGYVPTHPKYVKVDGGSNILEPFEIAPFSAKVREWVGAFLTEMTLIYRATRDGFGSNAFKSRCDKYSLRTISLVRVSSGQGNDDDSVLGIYSSVPWSCPAGSLQFLDDTFVFMLKDGRATRKGAISMPRKWHQHTAYMQQSFVVPRSDGPYVGETDMVTIFSETTGRCTMVTKGVRFQDPYSISVPFLAFNGSNVVEIEVYRTRLVASKTAAPSTIESRDVLTDTEAHDMHMFGQSIASSLVEERVVLDRAMKEMEVAGARVSAAVGALEAVYGPNVAAGEQDAVVELSVRGTRMTTLRSTLQSCPRSALSAMFNEDRWPAVDKDKDEHGRRLIDCDPACFSKILDVLRMRKRASWIRGVGRGKQQRESSAVLPGGLLIIEADAEAFREAVNMYFPGCESFITDVVRSM